ncbi:uncharacterized protein LOC128720630 [Anopheles nili]|uniref:uncharacterized protein LOC128720630 n=1 Tax=Anopheles nili TaxID=185578 RepID=UPI00237AC75A|nr:uncharacterized protein LOC128720630 [Anopheles nili]
MTNCVNLITRHGSLRAWIVNLVLGCLLAGGHYTVCAVTVDIFPLPPSTESLIARHQYLQGSLGAATMKNHIKRILNINDENSTLDSYLLSLFNTENLNPTYVFLLPMEGKNHVRKLIYQRSDFEEAEFPNITTVNKFTGKSNRTTAVSKPGVDMLLEKKIFEHIEKDTMDDGTRKVIEENVRTERNFIKFMDELNRDLEEEQNRRMLKESMRKSATRTTTTLFTPYTYRNTQTVGWDDLGLAGWAGGLREIHGHRFDHPVLEKPKTTTQAPTMLQASFNAVPQAPIRPTSTLGTPGQTMTNHSIASAAARYKQTGVLLSEDVGVKLQEIYKRTNGSNARVKWPITNSRDAHRDEDVFIARANNPFGHSTKWRWSNETEQEDPLRVEMQSSRDGRTKRGVYNLYSMIKCATGCDPIIYKGYGCYCGFLGSGQALDGIDRCCKMHDYCYSTANCPMFLEYFVPYLWKCYRGRPLCAIDHGEWGGPGSCASRLCHCDLSLSKCLRRYYCPRKRNVCTSSPLRLLQNLVMVF